MVHGACAREKNTDRTTLAITFVLANPIKKTTRFVTKRISQNKKVGVLGRLFQKKGFIQLK